MRDPARADSRSVITFLPEDAYIALLASASRHRRTPGARASELLLMALAVESGDKVNQALSETFARYEAASRAGTTAPTRPAPPAATPVALPVLSATVLPAPTTPEPSEEPPATEVAPLQPMKVGRGGSTRSWPGAAQLSARGQRLRNVFHLSPVQAAFLDILMNDQDYSTADLLAALPLPLRPPSVSAVRVAIMELRQRLGLSPDRLRALRGVGYRLTPEACASINATLDNAPVAS